jgi:hypothetical protein
MAAYGGYVAAQPADISGLVSEFGTKIAAQQQSQKEREERSALIEQQRAEKIAAKEEERAYREQQDILKDVERQSIEDNKIISKPIPFVGSKTLDDLSAKVVPLVADSYAFLNKEIKADPSKAADLSAKKANLNRDFQTYVEVPNIAIKGKQYLTEQAKNQSKIGQMLGGKYNSILDVGRKQVKTNDDYRLVFSDNDEEGKLILDSEVPVTAISNYAAYEDKAVDYDKDIADLKLGVYNQLNASGRSQIEIKSPKLNPEYQAVTNSFAKSKAATPPDIARILVELGGYGAYVDGQNNIAPQNQIDPATGNEFVKPVIKFELTDNGGYYPIVTQGMQREAEDLIKRKIDASVGADITKTRNPEFVSGESGVDKLIQRDEIREAKKMKPLLTKAKIANDFFYGNRLGEIKAAARLNGIGNPTISDKVDYKVLYGVPKGKKKVEEIARFNTPDEAYAYLTGKSNVVEAAAEYQLAKDFATENDLNIQPATKETLTFDMKAARGMAPGKSDEEIKAIIIKQNPGKRLLWQN